MNDGGKKLFWTAGRITFVGLLIAALTLLFTAIPTVFPDFDPFGLKKGRLAPPEVPSSNTEASFVPIDNDRPTVITLHNDGHKEVFVQKVEYRIEQRKETPKREPIFGAAPPIEVHFTRRNWNKKTNSFNMAFERPTAIPPEQFGTLELAIIESSWAGHTYLGTVTVTYNGGETRDYPLVEVDVLSKVPEK